MFPLACGLKTGARAAQSGKGTQGGVVEGTERGGSHCQSATSNLLRRYSAYSRTSMTSRDSGVPHVACLKAPYVMHGCGDCASFHESQVRGVVQRRFVGMRVSYSPDSAFPHGPQPESTVDAAQVARSLPWVDANSPQEHRPQVPGAVVEYSRR